MEKLTGMPVAKAMEEEIRSMLSAYEKRPCLAIVRIGENEADLAYERGAEKRLKKLDIDVRHEVFPTDIDNASFTAAFEALNADSTVDGILIMRPLPKTIDSAGIEAMLDVRKDVDGITKASLGSLFMGRPAFIPCTAEAVIRLLDHYHIDIAGKNAVVIGRSLVIGKPVSMLLLQRNATVTVCHSKTADLPSVCRTADILVTACGQAGLIDASYIKPGAAVVDVSINTDADGNLTGDCDAADVSEKAAYLTPVPGGVGSITTAVLALHTAQAFVRKCEEEHA